MDSIMRMTDEGYIDAGHILPVIEWMSEQMPGGMFLYRADGSEKLIFANSAMVQMFACKDIDEFKAYTGFTFRGLIHPEDYAAAKDAVAQQKEARRQNNIQPVRYRILRADGQVRYMDDFGHYGHLPGYGDVYYVFMTDVTEKHLMEEDIRRRTEVIDGLSFGFDSIYLLHLGSGEMIPYRLQTPYFQEMLRDRPAEHNHGAYLEQQGANWYEVMPRYASRYVIEEDIDRFQYEISEEAIRAHMREQVSAHVTFRTHGAGDEIRYRSMLITRIGDKQNVVVSFRDVTEETLQVQRDMAERLKVQMDLDAERRSNEIKSNFLFNVSHDIRTPMNAIMGFSDLARRHHDDPEKLLDYLGKVDESSHHLLSLIDDLLEMSKLECGQIELSNQPANLKEQMGIVVDMFQPQVDEKSIVLTQHYDIDDAEVLVDSNRLRRVLGNLVSNAVKFTAPGGQINIRVEQTQRSASGYVRYKFVVQDTGSGMSEEFMQHMFDAFEREASSTAARTIGTGLGLSITRNLLRIMGGSIDVQSVKGEGTTVTVDLPLKFASQEAIDAMDKPETTDTYQARGQHRILLVEDIEINRMLAETILEEAGFLVDSVPDGCDAVDAIVQRPKWYYDLVLMDIQMPVMNGYEATRAIRAIRREDIPSLPILALSANARDEDRRMSLDSGMNNHIAKPFDVARLIQTVNEYIAKRQID